jgi:hypothetical protein
MSKGKIVFYDDDQTLVNQFDELMSESGFEIIKYSDFNTLRKEIAEPNNLIDTKALVFDLARSKEEEGLSKNFEILKDINEKFDQYRIPIFIHSAFANEIDDFKNCGTVWKIEKSGTSLANIVEIITKLDDSGFLEAFTPKGIIEKNLFEELHRSFTEQFRKGEIVSIIDSIKKSNPTDYKKRTINVFRRIAIKALNSTLLLPLASNDDSVNPIEHFYRRNSKVFAWTGDIWINNDNTDNILILTPRCDLASGKATLLMVCSIKKSSLQLNGNKDKRLNDLHNHLTDNLLGKATRYLPNTPLFVGGMVNLSTYKTIGKEDLLANYKYCVTLSDELTNEIIGKFAYYFLRTGITTMNTEEFDSYLELLNETPDV